MRREARSILFAFGCLLISGVLKDSYAQQRDPGYSWNLEYTGDYMANLSGGAQRGQVFLGNLDATLELDGSRLWGTEGSRVFLYGLGNQGGEPSGLVGDAQGVNNIEANNTFRLYEAWIEQSFASSTASILAGLLDVNAEFDAIGTAGLFIHPSHGIGPDFSQSGENGPSIFPVTSLGIRARWVPRPNVFVQSAVLDGVSGNPDRPNGTRIKFGEGDGLLIVSEIGYLRGRQDAWISRTDEDGQELKAMLGFWTYTSKTATILEGPQSNNWGAYGLVESSLYQEQGNAGQGLSAWIRTGIARSSINRFGTYLGTGAVYTGLFNGRDEDQIGLALAMAFNTEDYQESQDDLGLQTTSAEHNIEFSYLSILTERVSVIFDIQYVINPNTDPNLSNAFVGAMRWGISL